MTPTLALSNSKVNFSSVKPITRIPHKNDGIHAPSLSHANITYRAIR